PHQLNVSGVPAFGTGTRGYRTKQETGKKMTHHAAILRFAVLTVAGFALAATGANATMLEFQLVDNLGGSQNSPSWGMEVNGGYSSYSRHGSYGSNDFFSFQNGSGSSTVTMVVDTETGCVTVSGQMRHGSTSWYGTQYSGEVWNYEATLCLLGDWNPQELEQCLMNDPNSVGDLNFSMESSSFQLASGYNRHSGYEGPKSWNSNSSTYGSGHHMSWNGGGGRQNRYSFQGWFSPFGYNGPKMFHDFGCDYTPPQCPPPSTVVPEPASLSLMGIGIAVLASRRMRKRAK
ncbi:MAG: PEP-CTERM sorting domain-containing protein, partial [Candidatus Hydrogenedentes bacterium]|nr:PEP-CTERM sorting domain-containing protein [Candidatus Hydrogenedentota bacterium]